MAGRLSLGSVGSDFPPLQTNNNAPSPNATATSDSLGLLDLDAMEGLCVYLVACMCACYNIIPTYCVILCLL